MKFDKSATINTNSPEFKMLKKRRIRIHQMKSVIEFLEEEYNSLHHQMKTGKKIPESYVSEYIKKKDENYVSESIR